MFKIKKYDSARDSIKKTKEQKNYNMIPPGTTIICGRTGSGKTTLIINILNEKNMLKDYFDNIYVFCLSPCMDLIDHVEKIKEDNMYDDDPVKLQELYDRNKELVKSKGYKLAPHTLFILDDIVQSNAMMNSKVLRDIFFGGTHAKCSLWLLTQHWRSVPKKLRMNPHSVILCHGVNIQEMEAFSEEWASPYITHKEFFKVVQYVLNEPYSFLFVNATNPNKKEMYHKGFNEVLVIS
jgi:energy-coupling factor transporter ATP-binding protein EcfA2